MGRIAKGLFGGRSKSEKILKRFQPTGFEAAGLSGQFVKTGKGNQGFFEVTRGEEAQDAIDRMVGLANEQAAEFRGLREDVRPGFGRLTEARVTAIQNTRRRTVGNLRAELGKRRVLGSNFAQDQITGTEIEFQQQEERARAESFLQELTLTGDLINAEFASSMRGVGVELDQLNFETGLAAQLANSASAQINANLMAQAEARAAQQASAESFINSLIEVMSPLKSGGFQGASSAFSGGSAAGGGAAAGGATGGAAIGGGAVAGGGAAAGGGGMFALASDRRLKTNIVRIGTRNGYPWYSFTIFGEQREGVMSDEVPAKFVIRKDGYDAVDYGALFNA